jgi:ubiquinone/menaquinone biosynthesis C-methylase UbiE
VLENTLKWDHYRWEHGENEWTPSAQWKQSVIDHVMLKNVAPDCTVLEIGPGFGRWTRKLVEISRRLIVVDISIKCIEHCKKVFGENDNIEFHLNDGRSLEFIAADSIDFVWSFDVFVHIEPMDVDRYLSEFHRILKKDGRIIIHHGIIGKTDHNWRSTLTLQSFTTLLQKHNFTLTEQFSSWGDNNEFKVDSGDVVSILKKS